MAMNTVNPVSSILNIKIIINNLFSVMFIYLYYEHHFCLDLIKNKTTYHLYFRMPPRVLKPEDFEQMRRSAQGFRGRGRGGGGRGHAGLGYGGGREFYRPQLGFQPHSGYREKDISSAVRMIR